MSLIGIFQVDTDVDNPTLRQRFNTRRHVTSIVGSEEAMWTVHTLPDGTTQPGADEGDPL